MFLRNTVQTRAGFPFFSKKEKYLWEHIHEPESCDLLDGVDTSSRLPLADKLVRVFVECMQHNLEHRVEEYMFKNRRKVRQLLEGIGFPVISELSGRRIFDDRFDKDIKEAATTALSRHLFGEGLKKVHQKIEGTYGLKTRPDDERAQATQLT